jgi:hypothetical protein
MWCWLRLRQRKLVLNIRRSVLRIWTKFVRFRLRFCTKKFFVQNLHLNLIFQLKLTYMFFYVFIWLVNTKKDWCYASFKTQIRSNTSQSDQTGLHGFDRIQNAVADLKISWSEKAHTFLVNFQLSVSKSNKQ